MKGTVLTDEYLAVDGDDVAIREDGLELLDCKGVEVGLSVSGQ